MSAILNEPSQPAAAPGIESHDTEELVVPMLVAARIAIEWSRISNDAGIRGWGNEHWGQSMTIGTNIWVVGYANRPGSTPILKVTVRGNEYGGGPKYQRTWSIDPEDLKLGVEMMVIGSVKER